MNKKWGLEIEKAATAFRQNNGFSGTEPIRLDSLLLKNDVLTLFTPLSQEFSGLSIKLAGGPRAMLVNSNQVLGKQHFTVGHELYHLFVQEDFEPHRCKVGRFDKKDKEEYRADVFAASLLLPEEGMLQLIPNSELSQGKVSLETVVKIEQFYSVSRRCALYRLYSIGLLGKDDFETYKLHPVKASAARLGYPTSLYEPGNANKVVGDYGVLASRLLETEKISESHYLEMMAAIGFDPFANFTDDDKQGD